VQAVVGRAVGNGHFPLRVVALHDFDAVGDPLDAAEQRLRVPGDRRARFEAEADFRLDARLDQPRKRHDCFIFFRKNKSPIINSTPHGLVDAIAFPERAVGEADLAADELPALRQAMGMQLARRGVARFGGKPRIARAKRGHLPGAIVQVDEFFCEFGCVHGQVILN